MLTWHIILIKWNRIETNENLYRFVLICYFVPRWEKRLNMKVLLVSSSFFPKIDGSTRCVYDHGRKLAEVGSIVYLVTRGVDEAKKYEVVDGIRVVRSNTSFRLGSTLSKLRLALEQMITIIRLHRAIHFDVIHVHGFTACISALPCKYIFGIPVFITTHGTELLWPKEVWWKSPSEVKLGVLFERFVLSRCDAIIVQSPGVRRYMLQIYGRGIGKKMVQVHTGIDHAKFKAGTRETSTPQVLFVGALSEIKGVSDLITSFAEARRSVPAAKLLLVGSGTAVQKYKELVNKLDLDGAVEFLGAIRDDVKLKELYRQSEVVVLPSNVGGPISVTILEGLSSGRAVISTNVPGGIPDVLGGGVGILVERGDRKKLAEELEKLMLKDDYRAGFEHRAREAVEELYTLDAMVDKLTLLYRKVAKLAQ